MDWKDLSNHLKSKSKSRKEIPHHSNNLNANDLSKPQLKKKIVLGIGIIKDKRLLVVYEFLHKNGFDCWKKKFHHITKNIRTSKLMASSNTISWKLKSSCYLFAHVSIKKTHVKFTIQIVVCSREGSKTTKHVSVANLLWLLGGVAFWLPSRFGELWSHNPCHPSIHTTSRSTVP